MCMRWQNVISYQFSNNLNYHPILFFVVVVFFIQTGQVLHGHSSSISESEEFKKAVQKVGAIHFTLVQWHLACAWEI